MRRTEDLSGPEGRKEAPAAGTDIAELLRRLDERYGTELICFLDHEADHEFLFAVILSAQCTDARVNMVTPSLYRQFPTLQSFADCTIEELEEAIHSIGFYHAKARNIKACAEKLLRDFGGKVPETMDELLTLPGVGRKTASVVLGQLYGRPAVAVDTHVKRISKKLGLTEETDPEKVEEDLKRVLPEDHWILCNMQLITLGRSICHARNPKCGECFLQDICPSCEAKR